MTLDSQQIPNHTHPSLGTSDARRMNTIRPTRWRRIAAGSVQFFQDVPNVNMAGNIVAAVGGSQPHDNLQPYLCINFIISLFGIFPSQT